MSDNPKYTKVLAYYEKGLWTAEMVKNAIDRWISADEAAAILATKEPHSNE